MRLAELERVNDDLERRLESQAKQKMSLEAEISYLDRHWSSKYAELENERDAWKGAVDAERRRSSGLREQIIRKDRELHRMLQRKYDGRGGTASQQPLKQPVGVWGNQSANSSTTISNNSSSISNGSTISGGNNNANNEGKMGGSGASPQDLLKVTVQKERGGTKANESKGIGRLLDFFGI